MTLPRIKRVLWLLFALVFMWQPLLAQEAPKDHAAETSANVPALNEFHKVIFKIWHTAWPNKDDEMLTALLPEIDKGVAAVAHAELPGILRDKKPAWEKGVEKLRVVAQEYRAAVETKQKQPLLDAAENLHAQYEALVRVIRPPLKQLEEFHAVLYMIYHYYMPEGSLDKIRGSVEPLREKMAALNRVALPTRFKGKEASFNAARKGLDEAVAGLGAALSSNDPEKIRNAVETMHGRYVALAAVFE